jgi:hypothetical protein
MKQQYPVICNNIDTTQGFGHVKPLKKKSKSKQRKDRSKSSQGRKKENSRINSKNQTLIMPEISVNEPKPSPDDLAPGMVTGMLAFKTSQCEKYYNKCLKLKQQVNKLKSELSSKDKLLSKQKSIFKEIKLMKD